MDQLPIRVAGTPQVFPLGTDLISLAQGKATDAAQPLLPLRMGELQIDRKKQGQVDQGGGMGVLWFRMHILTLLKSLAALTKRFNGWTIRNRMLATFLRS